MHFVVPKLIDGVQKFQKRQKQKPCWHFHFHLFLLYWLKFFFSVEEVHLLDSVGSFCGQNGTGMFVWHGNSFLTVLLKNMFTRSELNGGDLLLHESISFCCGWNLSGKLCFGFGCWKKHGENASTIMSGWSSKLATLINWEHSEVFREIISRKHFSFFTRQNYFGRWQYKWVTINPVPTAIKSKSSKQREEKKRATHYHRDENSCESAVRRRKKCHKTRNRTFRCIEIEFQLSIHCNKFGSWKSTTIIHLNIIHNSSLRELMHDACSSCFLLPARTQTFGSLSICAFVI